MSLLDVLNFLEKHWPWAFNFLKKYWPRAAAIVAARDQEAEVPARFFAMSSAHVISAAKKREVALMPPVFLPNGSLRMVGVIAAKEREAAAAKEREAAAAKEREAAASPQRPLPLPLSPEESRRKDEAFIARRNADLIRNGYRDGFHSNGAPRGNTGGYLPPNDPRRPWQPPKLGGR